MAKTTAGRSYSGEYDRSERKVVSGDVSGLARRPTTGSFSVGDYTVVSTGVSNKTVRFSMTVKNTSMPDLIRETNRLLAGKGGKK